MGGFGKNRQATLAILNAAEGELFRLKSLVWRWPLVAPRANVLSESGDATGRGNSALPAEFFAQVLSGIERRA
jgi:hypothetical protein